MSKYTEYVSSQSASEQLKADIYSKITRIQPRSRTSNTLLKTVLSISAAAVLALAIVLPITLINFPNNSGTGQKPAMSMFLSPGTVYEDENGNSIGLDRLEVTRTINYKGEEFIADGAFIVVYGTCDFTREVTRYNEPFYYVFSSETISLYYWHNDNYGPHKSADAVFRSDLLENNNSDGTLKGDYVLVFEMDNEGVELFLGDLTKNREEGQYLFKLWLAQLYFSAWSGDEEGYLPLSSADVYIDEAIINL